MTTLKPKNKKSGGIGRLSKKNAPFGRVNCSLRSRERLHLEGKADKDGDFI